MIGQETTRQLFWEAKPIVACSACSYSFPPHLALVSCISFEVWLVYCNVCLLWLTRVIKLNWFWLYDIQLKIFLNSIPRKSLNVAHCFFENSLDFNVLIRDLEIVHVWTRYSRLPITRTFHEIEKASSYREFELSRVKLYRKLPEGKLAGGSS